MTLRLRRRLSSQRGQSLAEWALAGTFLLVFVCGAAQVGVIYYSLMTVDTAAREAARVASENPGNTGALPGTTGSHICTNTDTMLACRAAYNSTNNPGGPLGGLIDTSRLQVSIAWSPYTNSSGTQLAASSCSGTGSSDGTVSSSISYDVPIFVPIVGTMLSNNGSSQVRTLATTVNMRVEPCDNTGGA